MKEANKRLWRAGRRQTGKATNRRVPHEATHAVQRGAVNHDEEPPAARKSEDEENRVINLSGAGGARGGASGVLAGAARQVPLQRSHSIRCRGLGRGGGRREGGVSRPCCSAPGRHPLTDRTGGSLLLGTVGVRPPPFARESQPVLLEPTNHHPNTQQWFWLCGGPSASLIGRPRPARLCASLWSL